MLACNSSKLNVIKTDQIGWSLWLAVASTGGYLISLILFCIDRIHSAIDRSHDYVNTYFNRDVIIPNRDRL